MTCASIPELNLGQHARYRWHADWGGMGVERGWSHHGLACLADGRVVTSRADCCEALVYDANGEVVTRFPLAVVDAHGLSIAGEPESPTLWVTDAGKRRRIGGDFDYPSFSDGGCWAYTLTGEVGRGITREHAEAYCGSGAFSAPTYCEIDHDTGDLWVCDGYGSQAVYAITPAGAVRVAIDGDAGAGRFHCPHWLHIDRRGDQPVLLVADRFNHRIQVFDMDGRFIRVIDNGVTRTPSVLTTWRNWLIVGELEARVTVLDHNDQVVGRLGSGDAYVQRAGWPNQINSDGLPQRPDDLLPGQFNSPHGLDCDADGNIFVAEWLIGGRVTKLERLSD